MRALVTAAAAVVLSGCAVNVDLGSGDKFRSDFHYSFSVQPNVKIAAESFNGAVEIEGWDRNDVEISGVKSASNEAARDAIKVAVRNSPESVDIRVIRPLDIQANMGAHFMMHVPRTAEVGRAVSSNGKVTVHDVARAAHLKSSNGPVSIVNVHGAVEAETSNAAIDATSLDGALVLNTSNGPIRAEKITGSLQAETSNGGITAHLAASPAAPIKLVSSNGPVELTLDTVPESDIHAETQNSSITLHLPAGTNARVNAATSNASVDCDFDLVGDRDKGRLKGAIGSGGHIIDLNTSNGRIRIAKGGA